MKKKYKIYTLRNMDIEFEKKRQEMEADNFARALLMPQKLVADFVSKMDKNDKHPLKTIAKAFEVDEMLMAMRLVELGYKY